jgi:hypothetical protein
LGPIHMKAVLTRAQRQVLVFIYLLIFGGKSFILVFPELLTNVEVVKYIH